MARIILNAAFVATVNADRDEFAAGHLVVDGSRIAAVGPGPAPATPGPAARVIDAGGCLAPPGFANTHHHLYQWLPRGLATDQTLFGWRHAAARGRSHLPLLGNGTADARRCRTRASARRAAAYPSGRDRRGSGLLR